VCNGQAGKKEQRVEDCKSKRKKRKEKPKKRLLSVLTHGEGEPK